MKDSDPWSQRLTVFCASLVIILAELSLMRELALRFWEHLAWLAISIAMLGFGVSGTMLLLVHHFLPVKRQTLQCFTLIGLGLSLPGSVWLADTIEVNLIQMVWQPSMMWSIGALEVILGIPFVFGGMFIGLALEDHPDKVGGHYAANFLGSAAGGIIALPLMFLTSPRMLILLGGISILAITLFFVRHPLQTLVWFLAAILMLILCWQIPFTPKISDEKDIVLIRAMADSKAVDRRYSPQGVIELFEAPAFHVAPGLAINYTRELPPQSLILIDGQFSGSLYKISSIEDLAFMDHTTLALAYNMGQYPEVLIDHNSGADQISLALFHGVKKITALTRNSQLVDILTNSSPASGINVYTENQVTFITGTLREQLQKPSKSYPLIVMPTVGADPAGLASTEPDSSITIEILRRSFLNLSPNGLLSISTNIHLPPRESLRLMNMLIKVLQENELPPSRHLAVIRNWATATIVASKSSLTTKQLTAIRAFCLKRGFDLIWLPELKAEETNRFHVLDSDGYYLGANSLLGDDREGFIDTYRYNLSIPDDNSPFFSHFKRWTPVYEQFPRAVGYNRTYIEIGTTLLFAALIQALVLATLFIIAPLIPVIGLPGKHVDQITILGFFSCLGLGFMLLEVGLLQRLTVYLAHPLWSSATIISGFLLFGGIGSSMTTLLRKKLVITHLGVIAAVVAISIMLISQLDGILGFTEGFRLQGRIASAYLFISPLAIVMGMVFPLGLKRLGKAQPQLIPWAWGANGFASVIATLCAPAIAMQWGFDVIVRVAIACYVCAAVFSLKLPNPTSRKLF